MRKLLLAVLEYLKSLTGWLQETMLLSVSMLEVQRATKRRWQDFPIVSPLTVDNLMRDIDLVNQFYRTSISVSGYRGLQCSRTKNMNQLSICSKAYFIQ